MLLAVNNIQIPFKERRGELISLQLPTLDINFSKFCLFEVHRIGGGGGACVCVLCVLLFVF